MRLLVSPRDVEEAMAAVEGGADIVDVKNPSEGSLGASFPWVIREIKNKLPGGIELSAAIGDLDFKPGTASLAAYGVSLLNVDYIKVGFYGIRDLRDALEMGRFLNRAISSTRSRLVLAGYADYKEIGAIDPLLLPEIARQVGAHGVMIDTARKNSAGLFQHLDISAVGDFVEESKNAGLASALAGSLGFDDLAALKTIQPDVVGIRGLACSGGDRNKGRISAERVRRIKDFIR
jgi:hypothetical protein